MRIIPHKATWLHFVFQEIDVTFSISGTPPLHFKLSRKLPIHSVTWRNTLSKRTWSTKFYIYDRQMWVVGNSETSHIITLKQWLLVQSDENIWSIKLQILSGMLYIRYFVLEITQIPRRLNNKMTEQTLITRSTRALREHKP